MDSNIEDIFNNEIRCLEELSKYSFEYGILSEDGGKLITISTQNLDETSNLEVKLSDIMYFVENGSIDLPAKHLLEKSAYYFNDLLNQEIENLISNIFNGDLGYENIENKLNYISNLIEIEIKKFFISSISNNNIVNNLIKNETDNSNNFYDLRNLSSFIKCRVIKNV